MENPEKMFSETEIKNITRAAQTAGAGGLASTTFWQEFEQALDDAESVDTRKSGLVQSLLD